VDGMARKDGAGDVAKKVTDTFALPIQHRQVRYLGIISLFIISNR
jgi:hypothetical protein